jgi:hypothetical protein
LQRPTQITSKKFVRNISRNDAISIVARSISASLALVCATIRKSKSGLRDLRAKVHAESHALFSATLRRVYASYDADFLHVRKAES